MAEKNFLVDEAIEIVYQAPNKQTGLTITAEIILPSGSKDSNFPDLTLSELLDKGIYSGFFTPNTGGEWKVVVHTDTGDGQVVKRYSVGDYNLATVGGVVEAVSTKVDDVDSDVAAVGGQVITVGGQVSTVDGKVDVIDGKVDAAATKVDDVQVTADSIETKVDNISTSVGALDTPPMIS
jgi:hypothetical protein